MLEIVAWQGLDHFPYNYYDLSGWISPGVSDVRPLSESRLISGMVWHLLF
jgi:hypothetical protein